jgi:hypothetical protein
MSRAESVRRAPRARRAAQMAAWKAEEIGDVAAIGLQRGGARPHAAQVGQPVLQQVADGRV